MANASWSWNAKVDVEGKIISTYWSVANGGKAQYRAAITIAVPANASVNVIEVASNETVTVVHTNQRCSKGAIDAVVIFVKPKMVTAAEFRCPSTRWAAITKTTVRPGVQPEARFQ